MNTRWIKKIVKPEILKLLEDDIGKSLLDIGLSNDFLIYDTKDMDNKIKLEKWDDIKLWSEIKYLKIIYLIRN